MNSTEEQLLRRMITESGQMWLDSGDRKTTNNPVIICTVPTRAFYLTWGGNVEGNN